MTRCVNDVDAMIAPERCCCSGGDGDTTLLFLNHVVHYGSTFVHFTDLVCLSGVVQNALCCCGLTGIDVGHDADVAVHVQWEIA